MRNLVNNKSLLLSVCLIIGLVTLLSQSITVEVKKTSKAQKEQTTDASQKTVIIAPSDAVTVNFFTLQIDGFLEISPAFRPIQKIIKVVPFFHRATTAFQHTLFRYIIAPNAP